MTSEDLERQMARVYRDLHRDLGGAVPAEQVTAVGRARYEAIRRDAAINDFIPVLVYRFAKEELVASRRDQLHDAA